jgi:hypothetical protein
MNDKIVPDIQIQCEYSSLNVLIEKLNDVLLNKEVVIVEHTLDGYGADLMRPFYGAMTHPAKIDTLHSRPGDANVLIPVGDHNGILVPNGPVIHDDASHPSGIDIHSDHVKIRYTQVCNTHTGRIPVKTYFTITAFRSLNE